MDQANFKHIEAEEAQERFDELVDLLKSGDEPGFVLCRNGKPSVLLLAAKESQ